MSRSARLAIEVGAALCVALALGVAFATARRRAGATALFDARASSLLTGPWGSEAVYDVLARLGRAEVRRRRPLFDFPEPGATRPAELLLLDPGGVPGGPGGPLEDAEVERVARYLRSGGTVLAAGSGGRMAACAGWRTHPVSKFGSESLAVHVRSAGAGLRLPDVGDLLEPIPAREQRTRKLVAACQMLTPARVDTVLATGDGRPEALRLAYAGGGELRLVADVGLFRNRAWRDSDAPYAMLPLLTPPLAGPLVWDEYHQGFASEDSPLGVVWTWLLGTALGWVALQLAAVALVALATTAVRFGPAVPAIERRRRSPIEHLEALGAGLQNAAGVETALELVVAGLRRRLSRTGQPVPRGADVRPWLGALELVLPTARGRDAARTLLRTLSQPGDVSRVIVAANAVEDVWEDLRPSTTPAAS